MTSREKAILAAIVGAGLLVRLIGIESLPVNDRELFGTGWPSFAAELPLVVGRLVAALASTLAVLLVAWPRKDDPGFGPVAGILLALDPLSILAASESSSAGFLALGGAVILRTGGAVILRASDAVILRAGGAARSDGSQGIGAIRLVALGVAGIGVVAILVVRASHSPDATDPALLAWYGDSAPWIAQRFAAFHHLGYTLVPLALASIALVQSVVFRVVALTLLAFPIVLFRPEHHGFTDFALISPVLASFAARTIASFRRREQVSGRPALVTPALVLLVLAVNAPILLSDALTGLRFPWKHVKAWLQSRDDLAPANTIIHSTAVELTRRALGPEWTVEAIPPLDPNSRLPEGTEGKRRVVVIPVTSGFAHGESADSTVLRAIEAIKAPDFAPLSRRFDLYRLEVRVFVLDR